MTAHTTYREIKRGFLSLFKLVDEYRAQHPDARLEYDEMNEEDPTIGFQHKTGNIEVHMVFVWRRVRE
jgi:hypothetical protein